VACKSDEDIYQGLLSTIPSHHFAFGRFTELADALGCESSVLFIVNWLSVLMATIVVVHLYTGITPKASAEPDVAMTNTSATPPDLPTVLRDLDTRLTGLHAALPPHTALVLLSGHSDPRRMSALNAKKNAFDTIVRSGKRLEDLDKEMVLTAQEGRELEEEAEKAKRGLLFVSVKM
jgi:RNA exonuclease 1